jgi:hypothetical protein
MTGMLSRVITWMLKNGGVLEAHLLLMVVALVLALLATTVLRALFGAWQL